MEILGKFNTKEFFKNMFDPINVDLFEGYSRIDEIKALNERTKTCRDYYNNLPDELITLKFESSKERQTYLSRFQLKKEEHGVYSVFLPTFTSLVLVGYYGELDGNFLAHLIPDIVYDQT